MAADRDHYKACYERTQGAYNQLWRAFLLVAAQFMVVAGAAVWGWAR